MSPTFWLLLIIIKPGAPWDQQKMVGDFPTQALCQTEGKKLKAVKWKCVELEWE